jgi:hypothetical protein
MSHEDILSTQQLIAEQEARARNFHCDPDTLLSEQLAAALLGVTLRALQAWRQRGGGPAFVRISARCIRYRRKDLIAWTEALLRRSTASAEVAHG